MPFAAVIINMYTSQMVTPAVPPIPDVGGPVTAIPWQPRRVPPKCPAFPHS